jgi:hypothetical protein
MARLTFLEDLASSGGVALQACGARVGTVLLALLRN